MAGTTPTGSPRGRTGQPLAIDHRRVHFHGLAAEDVAELIRRHNEQE